MGVHGRGIRQRIYQNLKDELKVWNW